jgi:hypothetical protein
VASHAWGEPAKTLPSKGSSRKRQGRQWTYTQDIADEICDRLAEGDSLEAICKDDHMPAASTVKRWAIELRGQDGAPNFADEYARARAIGYECLAEQVIAIGDDPCYFDGKPDNVLVQRARLMSENRKWLLSKLLPRQFGDKVTQELVGDPERPVVNRIELVAVDPIIRPRARIEDSRDESDC